MIPNFLLSPLTYALLIAIVLALGWRWLARWLRWSGLVAELVLIVPMTPLGANALVHMLEARVPAPAQCAAPLPTTIVLLAGGTERVPRSADDYAALTTASLRRLFGAVRLWRKTPDAELVIAGGGRRIPESRLLAGLAEAMGVPAAGIRTEVHSRSTWENATGVAALRPPVPRRVWLVSSALHLPRATLAFRAAGFEPCPWSSDSEYVRFHPNIGYFIPQSSALAKADRAVHELVGGWVYAWRAWRSQRADDRAAPSDEPRSASS